MYCLLWGCERHRNRTAAWGIPRDAFRVQNGRTAIFPEMALRIEARLGVERGGEARLWLAEQSACDVWQVEQQFKTAPMHVQPAPVAT